MLFRSESARKRERVCECEKECVYVCECICACMCVLVCACVCKFVCMCVCRRMSVVIRQQMISIKLVSFVNIFAISVSLLLTLPPDETSSPFQCACVSRFLSPSFSLSFSFSLLYCSSP